MFHSPIKLADHLRNKGKNSKMLCLKQLVLWGVPPNTLDQIVEVQPRISDIAKANKSRGRPYNFFSVPQVRLRGPVRPPKKGPVDTMVPRKRLDQGIHRLV